MQEENGRRCCGDEPQGRRQSRATRHSGRSRAQEAGEALGRAGAWMRMVSESLGARGAAGWLPFWNQ